MVLDVPKDSMLPGAGHGQFNEGRHHAGEQSLEASGELSQGKTSFAAFVFQVDDVVAGLCSHGFDPSGNQSCRVSISSQKAGS